MIDPLNVDETIVAQATAREPGFRCGIIRLAGENTLDVLKKCVRAEDFNRLEETSSASQIKLHLDLPDFDQPVPSQLLYWPDNRSYTRQPAAEIHTYGSLPLLDSIVGHMCQSGARLAQPGEFTMRAFLSGRMDLTEAEAVLGVIDAEDKKQLDVALDQLSGGISKPLHHARQELLHSLANLEAGLDFVEEDIEFVTASEIQAMIGRCLSELVTLKQQIEKRDQSNSTFRAVLFGKPNTGKSSLFNALVDRFGDKEREADRVAIVSNESGTTTDFVTASIHLDGLDVELIDTAGIDELELDENGSALAQGQSQSNTKRDSSDVTLFCVDATAAMSHWEKEQLAKLKSGSIVCVNKIDQESMNEWRELDRVVATSSMTGKGIDELAHQIFENLTQESHGETVAGTAVRCSQSVILAIEALERADDLVEAQLGEEFVASEIRLALDAVGKITGVIYTDDILDVVFKQFCIGK